MTPPHPLVALAGAGVITAALASVALGGEATPRPSPSSSAPVTLSATQLSRMNPEGRAGLLHHAVIVSGFVGDMLTVNDGHDVRRVLRIATSSNGANAVVGCVAQDPGAFDRRVRGANLGTEVAVEGFLAAPADARAMVIAHVAPIVIVACRLMDS